MEEKQRMIQEYVPGKQVTLAHLIANPDEVIFEKLGLQAEIKDAIGILTIRVKRLSLRLILRPRLRMFKLVLWIVSAALS